MHVGWMASGKSSYCSHLQKCFLAQHNFCHIHWCLKNPGSQASQALFGLLGGTLRKGTVTMISQKEQWSNFYCQLDELWKKLNTEIKLWNEFLINFLSLTESPFLLMHCQFSKHSDIINTNFPLKLYCGIIIHVSTNYTVLSKTAFTYCRVLVLLVLGQMGVSYMNQMNCCYQG